MTERGDIVQTPEWSLLRVMGCYSVIICVMLGISYLHFIGIEEFLEPFCY